MRNTPAPLGHRSPRPPRVEPADVSLLLVKVAALVEEAFALLYGNQGSYRTLTQAEETHYLALLAAQAATWHAIRCQRSPAMRSRDPLPEWLQDGQQAS